MKINSQIIHDCLAWIVVFLTVGGVIFMFHGMTTKFCVVDGTCEIRKQTEILRAEGDLLREQETVNNLRKLIEAQND